MGSGSRSEDAADPLRHYPLARMPLPPHRLPPAGGPQDGFDEDRYRPKIHSGTQMNTALPITRATDSVDHPVTPSGSTPRPYRSPTPASLGRTVR